MLIALQHASRCRRASHLLGAVAVLLIGSNGAVAQSENGQPPAASTAYPAQPLTERERQLLDRIDKLEKRVEALEADQRAGATPASTPIGSQALAATAIPASPPAATQSSPASTNGSSLPDFLSGTTLSFDLDGYYGYNFNRPVGRVNLLRAYDVSSDSFSLNQAGIIVERAPDVSAGRRLGMRLDLMFGQATETLQGSAANEPRPQVYRNIFQAYGTYVAPLGSGLTVDFGKWASALGYENNYTKDQLNYSRSFLFNFLPFYHFGVRTSYNVNDKLSIQYWLVNGANQSEDFNGFKSDAVLVTLKPTKNVVWNLNYYVGREQRDLVPLLNPGIPALPTQPGLSTTPVLPTPNGREHILDTYVSWNVTPKLFAAGEADYVINRALSTSAPSRVDGGAGYLKYQFAPAFSLAGRFEYLSDRGGLFSGTTQALKEGTLTATYQFVDGFQMRGELRRDFSNQPFFLTQTAGVLKREQDTVTLGLVWWFGGKQGAW